MLDFHKVMAQMDKVGRESLVDRAPRSEVVETAGLAYRESAHSPEKMLAKLEAGQSCALWPVAVPLEPWGGEHAVALEPQPVTVVAADGSQIMPSHHEVHTCYLLNIGLAVLSYGVKLPPLLESEPRLYHRPEDLYPLVDRRRVHIDELYVSLERNLLELETLAQTAVKAAERALPVVSYVDGSLIPWSVEKMPPRYQEDYLARVERAMDILADAAIPLLGYLSASRSSDLVNDLRIWKCPYPLSDCRQHCGHLNEESFPCSSVWPLSDRQLLSRELPFGRRTPVFLSGASVARSLSLRQRVCFSYLNVGNEVARIEFPRWLSDRKDLLDLAFSTTLAQVSKGRGYPVSLAEAHNLAVIRAPERARFFELLTRHLVSLGVERVSVSPKESRKRRGVI